MMSHKTALPTNSKLSPDQIPQERPDHSWDVHVTGELSRLSTSMLPSAYNFANRLKTPMA
jgi:hypothetical protein